MENTPIWPDENIESIVTTYQTKLYRTALAITGNATDAEDIVQEVFVKLYQKQPVFETEAHQTAWLIRVTVNMCKNHLRNHWWKWATQLLESHPAQTETQANTMEAVLALPVKYRVVIHLFYYEGYSTKEIAEITSQKEPTVRQLLSRARGKLKTLLKGED